MKGGIASFVVALERFISKHPDHDGSIGVILTSDEEGEAVFGTKEVVSELTRRGTVVDMCIVGEPSSISSTGDTVKVGRRGSLGGELMIHGIQGHVAYVQQITDCSVLLVSFLQNRSALNCQSSRSQNTVFYHPQIPASF